jgi:hypothetical protein
MLVGKKEEIFQSNGLPSLNTAISQNFVKKLTSKCFTLIQ